MSAAETATVAFRLPDLGEGVVKSEIVRWLIEVGDTLAEDQPMVEVMTDKATVEIPSPAAGTVSALHAAAGEVVAVGSTICEISGVDPSSAGVIGASARAATMGDTPATGGSSPAGNGSGVSGNPAHGSGASSTSVVGGSARPGGGKIAATPLVRRLAGDLSIDLAGVVGTGPGGRILEADVRGAAAGGTSAAPVASGPTGPGPSVAAGSAPGPATTTAVVAAEFAGVSTDAVTAPVASRVPLRGMRRAIAQHLTAAQAVPTVTVVEECDLTALGEVRSETGASWVAYTVRAVVAAIAAEPSFNATLDAAAGEVRVHDRIDVGIAVQTDGGLVVPVLRDAGAKSLAEIDAEIGQLGAGAKAATLKPEQLRGSTITVTCAGKLGGLFTTPLLNVPEVAIVGLHRAGPQAVVRDGEIVIRTMANISISFDHRANDGLDASRFLLATIADMESGRA